MPDAVILVNLSGRGDKDMDTAARYFHLYDDGADAAAAAAAQHDDAAKGEGEKL